MVGAGTKTSVSERQEVECWLQGLAEESPVHWDRVSVWKDEKFWRWSW